MLTLTRKIGETIVIDDNIELTVVSISGNQVKLSIKAPLDIKVHRKELKSLSKQQKEH